MRGVSCPVIYSVPGTLKAGLGLTSNFRAQIYIASSSFIYQTSCKHQNVKHGAVYRFSLRPHPVGRYIRLYSLVSSEIGCGAAKHRRIRIVEALKIYCLVCLDMCHGECYRTCCLTIAYGYC